MVYSIRTRMPRTFVDVDGNVWPSNVFKSNGVGVETCAQKTEQNKLKYLRIDCRSNMFAELISCERFCQFIIGTNVQHRDKTNDSR